MSKRTIKRIVNSPYIERIDNWGYGEGLYLKLIEHRDKGLANRETTLKLSYIDCIILHSKLQQYFKELREAARSKIEHLNKTYIK